MRKHVVYLVFLAAFTSCNHYYYVPTTHNVPLLKEKNEFRATLSAGSGTSIATSDFQAAYAVTNHIAVLTNVMLARGDGEGGTINSEDKGSGQCFEFGVGYFDPIGESGVFEIYGGFGVTNQSHEYTAGGTADLSARKFFLQPTIALSLNAFDLAFTMGFSSVNFYRIDNQVNPMSTGFGDVERIARYNRSLLFEPALTLRGGWKYVKVQFQFGISDNWTHGNLGFEVFKLNAGLSFGFAQRFLDNN